MCVALAAPAAQGQSFDATNLPEPKDLGVTWLVHGGDDPAYARPDFDDSGWMKFDTAKDLRDLFPQSKPEIVWYRLRLKILPSQTGLALKEQQIGYAFEVYSGGVQVMKLGQVKPYVAYTSLVPLLARIPDSQVATGPVVIAVRARINPAEWGRPSPGLYSGNLFLGREHELREDIRFYPIRSRAVDWMIALFGAGLSMVALALYFTQRDQRVYLWLALQLLVGNLYYFYDPAIHNYPAHWIKFLDPLNLTALVIFTLLMYFAFLGKRVGRRIWCYFAAAAMLDIGWTAYKGALDTLYAPFSAIPLLLLNSGLVPILLVVHLRRGNREAGILLIPNILGCLFWYLPLGLAILSLIPSLASTVFRVNALTYWRVGPVYFSLGSLSNALGLLSLTIIIVLRSIRISRKQTELEGELEAARQVQQVLLPDAVETVPGFAVESVYQPAQQVGGDFFQILPAEQGGLLVVVGDVAGKGLPAAMMVSVLVGAIRGVAEYTKDPAELLSNLNERLVGRGSGSISTALVAHIAADGLVTIANAGHLSPYLDGSEVELPGALPLGVVSGASYETIQFSLDPGNRLTFYSDGVVEAQNQKGELFGFDRAKSISTQPAAAIVEAAKTFGQEDDITVLTIERKGVKAPTANPLPVPSFAL